MGEAFGQEEIVAYNAMLVEMLREPAPDFVWFEWPRRMEAATLRAIKASWPACQLVCFQDDNPFGSRPEATSLWGRFVANIPLYDVHFVKREMDLVEFARRGARSVHLFEHGVYEPLFHPGAAGEAPAEARWPVAFVGTALDHRVDYVSQLLGRHRLPLHVFGTKWNRTQVGWVHRRHFQPPLLGEPYARAIRESAISLGFVSSSNRDEYSMRSFEIPGSAGFMLAERTAKHLTLYEEGREAEFFSSVEECADKIVFYLKNASARREIARRGYGRCLKSGYFLRSRMREALALLFPGKWTKSSR